MASAVTAAMAFYCCRPARNMNYGSPTQSIAFLPAIGLHGCTLVLCISIASTTSSSGRGTGRIYEWPKCGSMSPSSTSVSNPGDVPKERRFPNDSTAPRWRTLSPNSLYWHPGRTSWLHPWTIKMWRQAWRTSESWSIIPLQRRDGKLFNPRRLQAKTKIMTDIFRYFLLADDCALKLGSEADIQRRQVLWCMQRLRPYHQYQEDWSITSASSKETVRWAQRHNQRPKTEHGEKIHVARQHVIPELCHRRRSQHKFGRLQGQSLEQKRH